jgi:hypothetical protein
MIAPQYLIWSRVISVRFDDGDGDVLKEYGDADDFLDGLCRTGLTKAEGCGEEPSNADASC